MEKKEIERGERRKRLEKRRDERDRKRGEKKEIEKEERRKRSKKRRETLIRPSRRVWDR